MKEFSLFMRLLGGEMGRDLMERKIKVFILSITFILFNYISFVPLPNKKKEIFIFIPLIYNSFHFIAKHKL